MNIFYLTCVLWVFSEVILNRLVRSGKSDKKTADKKSELYVWISILLSISVGVFISATLKIPIYFNESFGLIGVIIIIVGIIIRFIAIRQLGRFFTVNVAIRKNHQLIQKGFYKYLRHPSYSGSLLSFLGLGLSLNNWLSLVVIFLPILFAFIHRMNIEENVLDEEFGNQYKDYIQHTKRIIPFLY